MNRQQFEAQLQKKGIVLSPRQRDQFKRYYELLIQHNQRINLTAITDEGEVYLKHFYDSLTPLFELEYRLPQEGALCDVGAGAGFPSIPLKIVRPDLKLVIVDSLKKRIDFLNQLIDALALKGVEAIHARAEEYVQEAREAFDVVTARAVARLNILVELCLPLVKVGGACIALKGASGEEELTEARRAIETLGGSCQSVVSFKLPENGGKRTLIVIEKRRHTPPKYPRPFGQIKKKPL